MGREIERNGWSDTQTQTQDKRKVRKAKTGCIVQRASFPRVALYSHERLRLNAPRVRAVVDERREGRDRHGHGSREKGDGHEGGGSSGSRSGNRRGVMADGREQRASTVQQHHAGGSC